MFSIVLVLSLRRQLEEAYKAGKVRAIGVSNFYPDRYLDIAHFAQIVPAVNQVALRFLLQSDVVVIPKSTHIERMQENFDVFDFALDEVDMQKLSALDTGKSLFFSHYDPATVEWFMSICNKL